MASILQAVLLSFVLVLIPFTSASGFDVHQQHDVQNFPAEGDCISAKALSVSLLQTQHQHRIADSEQGTPNVHVDFGNHGSPEKCSQPLFAWFNETFRNSTASSLSLLDVGGGTGEKSKFLQTMDERLRAQCIDVVASDACPQFDGESLVAYADNSVDFVMFSYVLHHAADQSIPLLVDAKRVAKQAVVILEDLKGDTDQTLAEQYGHPGCKMKGGCTFRGAKEWEALFKLAGMRVMTKRDVSRHCMAPYYLIPRGLYALHPN